MATFASHTLLFAGMRFPCPIHRDEKIPEFYVLLILHLGIILVNNQHDAQLFFLTRLFQFSTCFEQQSAHHQENQLYQYNFWYMSHCVGDRLVCRSGRELPDLHTRRSPTECDIYQKM